MPVQTPLCTPEPYSRRENLTIAQNVTREKIWRNCASISIWAYKPKKEFTSHLGSWHKTVMDGRGRPQGTMPQAIFWVSGHARLPHSPRSAVNGDNFASFSAAYEAFQKAFKIFLEDSIRILSLSCNSLSRKLIETAQRRCPMCPEHTPEASATRRQCLA